MKKAKPDNRDLYKKRPELRENLASLISSRGGHSGREKIAGLERERAALDRSIKEYATPASSNRVGDVAKNSQFLSPPLIEVGAEEERPLIRAPVAVSSVETARIAADWAQSVYYEKAEDADWLALFWGNGTRFKRGFDTLDLTNVLEIACGRGRHTAQFLAGAGSVTLLDVNETNITACRDRFNAAKNIEFVVSDGSSLKPLNNDTFSAVFSYDSMVLFEFSDVLNYLKECFRVLRPKGRALLHLSDYWDNPGGYGRYNPLWRNFMSMEIAIHVSQRIGFEMVQTSRFPWGTPADGRLVSEKQWTKKQARDCLVLLQKPA